MKRNAQTSHRSKPIRLPFGESLSKKYAAERDREQSARNEQEAALKPHRAVMDAFGRWDDVWRAVEDCHAGAKFNWGYRPCNPVELLEDQLKRMLAATVGLCGEDNVRLAFNKFSAEGYQGYDLDAASTVRVILEAFVAMLDGAKPREVADSLYQLAALPHLCGAKAVINVVQIADRIPNICQCGNFVGYPFDMHMCSDCEGGKGSNTPDLDSGEKGVAAFDVALLLEKDLDAAKSWVRRFTSDAKLNSIGKCPIDARKTLYNLDELIAEIENKYGLSRRDKSRILKASVTFLRSPKAHD